MTLSLFLSSLVGYLLGSIPTAYLLVHWRLGIDIRLAGSGNVGTLNSYQVTNSKVIGLLVLVIDLLKGMIAVAAASMLPGADFAGMAAAGVASVAGHNFSPWLRFKGGRGLATAAGAALVLEPLMIPVWGIFWAAGYALTKRVNIGNAIASLLTACAAIMFPSLFLEHGIVAGTRADFFQYFVVALFTLVLLKHIVPVREYIHELISGRE